MKRAKPNLLERKLTRRMIQVQLTVLALFFGFGVFPTVIYPILTYLGDSEPLDPTTTAIFARSLGVIDGDAITIVQTPALTKLREANPNVWLYALTQAGASATLGTIPETYRVIEDNMWDLVTLEVSMAAGGDGAVLVRPETSSVGMVRVMTGGGPTVGVGRMVGKVSTYIALAITGLLFFASAIAIPLVVRREMRGLKMTAERAKLIDVHSRGTRLPTENVPEEVRSLVDAVNDGLARLDDSSAKRERFLADSAHELRTPIAILQTRIETAEPFALQSRLLVDVARLASLADQLLDLQRMDLNDSAFEPVDLVDLAGVVVGDLAPLAIAAGYELSLNAPDHAVMVNGDIGSLMRALTNVIQNAIAYGGDHGEILVDVAGDGTIMISDDSPGIAPAERDRVFEPFYRVKPSVRGAGLGLNLVETIVHRHHGHVWIADAVSGGACFVITLPVLKADIKKFN